MTANTLYKRVSKYQLPTIDEMKDGALVLYTNGNMELIMPHIRTYDNKWVAGSSDDVTHLVECWFKKEQL